MAPVVELSEKTFSRLQKLAVPLVDNAETVINRLLDEHEHSTATSRPGSRSTVVARDFNPAAPPSLTHTKVLSARFDGRELDRGEVTWNGLLNTAIRAAKAHAQTDDDEFRRLVIINFVTRKKDDEGYRFLDDLGISVQGQDANGAWKGTFHIAQRLGRSLDVTFTWRDKPDAAFPGVIGRLTIPARDQAA